MAFDRFNKLAGVIGQEPSLRASLKIIRATFKCWFTVRAYRPLVAIVFRYLTRSALVISAIGRSVFCARASKSFFALRL
jgi:hypothetical protein